MTPSNTLPPVQAPSKNSANRHVEMNIINLLLGISSVSTDNVGIPIIRPQETYIQIDNNNLRQENKAQMIIGTQDKKKRVPPILKVCFNTHEYGHGIEFGFSKTAESGSPHTYRALGILATAIAIVQDPAILRVLREKAINSSAGTKDHEAYGNLLKIFTHPLCPTLHESLISHCSSSHGSKNQIVRRRDNSKFGFLRMKFANSHIDAMTDQVLPQGSEIESWKHRQAILRLRKQIDWCRIMRPPTGLMGSKNSFWNALLILGYAMKTDNMRFAHPFVE